VIVFDASAAIELLLGTPIGLIIAARIGLEDLHAPHLLDMEVAQALRKLEAAGRIDDDRGREAIEDLSDLDVTRYEHYSFLPRVWELRANVTAYDAVYVALAEMLDAPLLTTDVRLAGSRVHRARIELVR
jgi:predicted nucleic acid-binding protein